MNANYFVIYIGQVFFIADFSKEKRCLNGISFFFHILSKKKLEPWFQNHKGGEDVQTTPKTDQRSEKITFR